MISPLRGMKKITFKKPDSKSDNKLVCRKLFNPNDCQTEADWLTKGPNCLLFVGILVPTIPGFACLVFLSTLSTEMAGQFAKQTVSMDWINYGTLIFICKLSTFLI